ncbi:hypothetical protein CLAFUW4_05447 [Fulvia fulva]|uniref:Uncharacterized protein n=1 Tax=Passalora fulva TaxID=5499 RepID=A0A9Q8LJK6_PASFU|nr:uncharacterized protein CLAFUR5_05591 [Fulvia fulva]KAK4624080.1 hypothetical protein CLAFUR4_05441 [Fulvia fulva]KAK4624789.1 hypothetical protein CLAFUR0_05449 [Fulvia fulva]UJO17828.1 hypothetical protein CLAFUR5_05591 [Fulvia fulva]WPV15575.1 hypothetical protein CLAFUW4_05447 [Fulvia fulva]WPV30572.1 hypothetical protein CLAFUW7_05445 [Fulvia fulva]
MHFAKLRSLFHRKATIAQSPQTTQDGEDDSQQHGNAVVVGEHTERPLQPLPSPGSSFFEDEDTNLTDKTLTCRHPSYRPLFWPNADRAPSMMHFYVPSRSRSPSSSASASSTTAQELFRDFSGTFPCNESLSSSDLRPGAVSRISNNNLRQRDSKLHDSITIQCHPAILDNPPPFQRYSSPPKIEGAGPPDLAKTCARKNTNLRRQASILEIQNDLFATRLEQTIQDLENMTCTRDVTRRMLVRCNELRLQAEKGRVMWREKYNNIYSGVESLLRANNAMEQQIRNLEEAHSHCTQRELGLQERIDTLLTSRWRGSTYLKRRLMETSDRNNILANNHDKKVAQLEKVQQCNIGLQRRIDVADDKVARLQKLLQKAKEEREEDTEALQLAEKEVYQLSENLRSAQTCLKDKSAALEQIVQEKERLQSLLRLTGS